jgi:hypothetical protein
MMKFHPQLHVVAVKICQFCRVILLACFGGLVTIKENCTGLG